MPEKDNSFHVGHRDRLRQKFLDGKLADYEMLELLLGYIIPRRDVRPLARGLIQEYGNIYQILCAPYESLLKYNGIGRNTAIFFKLMQQLMNAGYQNHLKEGKSFHNEQTMANYCKLMMAGKNIEEFHVMYFDENHRLLDDWLHSTGTIDWAAVYPREIVRRGLELNARHVVLLHNHPISGGSFSTPDITMTEEMAALLGKIGICLDDHYLISNGILYSARNMQLFK